MTPEPTRQSHASLAMISIGVMNQRRWLAQWNESWQAISFVGGHREHGESYRECMIREIGEELSLSMPIDFRVPGKPAKVIEYTALSKRTNQWTRYHLELYSIGLAPGIADRLRENPNNHWLAENEIKAGITANKVPISPSMKSVFDEADLWTVEEVPEYGEHATKREQP